MTIIRSYLLFISCLFALSSVNGQEIQKLWDVSTEVADTPGVFKLQHIYKADSSIIALGIIRGDSIMKPYNHEVDSLYGLTDIVVIWSDSLARIKKSLVVGGNGHDEIEMAFLHDDNIYVLVKTSSDSSSGNLSRSFNKTGIELLKISKDGTLKNTYSFIVDDDTLNYIYHAVYDNDKALYLLGVEEFQNNANTRHLIKYCLDGDSVVFSQSQPFIGHGRYDGLCKILLYEKNIEIIDSLNQFKLINSINGEIDSIYNLEYNKVYFHQYLFNFENTNPIGLNVTHVDSGGLKSENSLGLKDYWIIKHTRKAKGGGISWEKTIGGSFDEGDRSSSWWNRVALSEQPQLLIETNRRELVLAGTSKSNKSGDKSENRRGGQDYWLVLLDSNGNMLTDKTLGSKGDDVAHGVMQYGQNRYMVWGYSNGSNDFDRTDTAINSNGDNWLVGFCIAPPKELNITDTALCQGDSILIQATEGYRYHWNTGDTTAQIWVSKTDSYHVTLFGENGCNTRSDTAYVQINPYPSGAISTNADTNLFCNGDSIELLAPTGYKAYHWSNGDTSQTTWIQQTDTISIDLVSAPNCRAAVDTFDVKEIPAATANFSIQTIEYACDSARVLLADSSKNVNKSLTKWQFGKGSADTSLAEHYFHQNGNYVIRQWVSNGICANSSYDTVQIAFSATMPAIITMADTGACTPDTVLFSLPDTSIVDSAWLSIGDTGLKASGLYQHVFTKEGIYAIVQKVHSANGCVMQDSLSYRVFHQPNTRFALVDSAINCGEKTYSFQNHSLPDSPAVGKPIFSWWIDKQLSNKTNTMNDSFSASFITSGRRNISLSHQIGHCQDSVSLAVWPQIEARPQAAAQLSSTGFCAPDSLELINQSPDADSAVWQLNQHLIISNKQKTNLYIDTAGQLDVQLYVYSQSGCIDSLNQPLQVDVQAKPTAYFALGQKGVCPPFQVLVDSIAQHPDGVQYQWAIDDQDTFSNTDNFSFNINSYRKNHQPLRLVTRNAYCTDTFARVIESRPLPSARFRLSDSAFCVPYTLLAINESERADSSFWSGVDTAHKGTDTAQWSIDSSGEFSLGLQVYTQHGCVDSTFKTIKAYPNPDATFSLSPRTGCSPLEVEVTPAQTRLNGFDYTWQLNGRDTFSHEAAFSFVLNKNEFNSAGQSLQLILSNPYCSDTSAQQRIYLKGFTDTARLDLNYATVHDSMVEVVWEKVPKAESYQLERFSRGQWWQLSNTEDTFFIDQEAHKAAGQQYRVFAIDSCGSQSQPGNWGEPMHLTVSLQAVERQLALNWQAYEKWDDGVDFYKVQQWNGSSFSTIYSTHLTNYTQKTNSLLPVENWIFRVVAFENGGQDSSASWPAQVKENRGNYIPNAFSPNGDGVNDEFKINFPQHEGYTIQIFNRWGSLVFKGNENSFWDGTFKNEPVESGKYFYIISKDDQELSGIVTVIK